MSASLSGPKTARAVRRSSAAARASADCRDGRRLLAEGAGGRRGDRCRRAAPATPSIGVVGQREVALDVQVRGGNLVASSAAAGALTATLNSPARRPLHHVTSRGSSWDTPVHRVCHSTEATRTGGPVGRVADRRLPCLAEHPVSRRCREQHSGVGPERPARRLVAHHRTCAPRCARGSTWRAEVVRLPCSCHSGYDVAGRRGRWSRCSLASVRLDLVVPTTLGELSMIATATPITLDLAAALSLRAVGRHGAARRHRPSCGGGRVVPAPRDQEQRRGPPGAARPHPGAQRRREEAARGGRGLGTGPAQAQVTAPASRAPVEVHRPAGWGR